MPYIMKELNADILNLTAQSWSDLSDGEVFEIELKHHLDWAKDHIYYDDKSKTSFAYGIFQEGHPDGQPAEAIIEIIQSPTGKRMTKLLKIVTSPRLWDDNDLDAVNDLREVTTAAIQATVTESDKNGSQIIKFYGRNSSLLKILSSINKKLNEQIEDPTHPLHKKLSSRIVNRWLELSIV